MWQGNLGAAVFAPSELKGYIDAEKFLKYLEKDVDKLEEAYIIRI